MLKKFFAILTACALMFTINTAALGETQQENVQTLSFSLNAHVESKFFSEESLIAGFADGLDTMTYTGEITYNDRWMFDLVSEIMVKNKSYITLNAQSNSQWITLTSNLFGDERIALMMQVYLEFAMKPYNYMDIPLQYFALLTSRYAHLSAWEPLIELCRPVLGVEGSRVIDTQGLVALAQQIEAYAQESREMRYWITALLMDLGVDDVVYELLAQLPGWVEENAGEEGLVITCEGESETWMMGDTVIYEKTAQGGYGTYAITLPNLCGYTLSVYLSWLEGGEFAFEASAALDDMGEEEAVAIGLKVYGSGLPDGQAQGDATAQVEIYGYLMPDTINAKFAGQWETATDDSGHETIEASVQWLDDATGEPIVSLTGNFRVEETKQELLGFTSQDLEQGATNVFTLYDETLRDFVGRVKKPLVSTLVPFLLALPASFSVSALDLLEQTGFADLLSDGL